MTLEAAFRDQAKTCSHMGSPLSSDVLTILADNWPQDGALAEALSVYNGDLGPAGHSLPLRVLGGLHALVLSGRDPGLAGCYPPEITTPTVLSTAVQNALETHEDFLVSFVQSPPQTNEVRRSAALIAGAHVARSWFDKPFVISELGASGGLNLNWDQYALSTGESSIGAKAPALTLRPDWEGPIPPMAAPNVVARAGVDLQPLDPSDAADSLRLTSYLWVDQPERLALTAAATQVQTTKVAQGDAIDWLDTRLKNVPAGHLHFIQHTVAWQYFPAVAQARGTALIEAAGAEATTETPIAWMQMETDGDRTGAVGAALTLRLWPGDVTLQLGRADFHGRWIKWAYEQTAD